MEIKKPPSWAAERVYMLYSLGGLTLIAAFWYLFHVITVYIGSAPARGKGIHPNAMRYFEELKQITYPYSKDKDVIECLMAANRELCSQFNSFQGGTNREYPQVLFGPESFDKNREEVWAIWVLLNFSNKSSTIKGMQDKLLKRMKELSEDKVARPPVLFENCRPYQDYVRQCELAEEDRLFKQALVEHIARSSYRKHLPDTSMDTMLTIFDSNRYKFGLYSVKDITQEKINKLVLDLAKHTL